MYIYNDKNWPNFKWDIDFIEPLLSLLRYKQGKLLGRMESLGFNLQKEAILRTLTQDVVKSSEIEGEILDTKQVRSSIARRLGVEVGTASINQNVEGIVEMMLDAVKNFEQPLTQERLFKWHASLFPTGRSGINKIFVGEWRNDAYGPMQVISGPFGKEKIHFQAPSAQSVNLEMAHFLKWFNKEEKIDLVLKAGIAHFWFLTIHPFEDGNGRIARTLTDMLLARSENSSQRFYSFSSQIRQERNKYYNILEKSQKGTIDITLWLEWFLKCLERAIEGSQNSLETVLFKARFWEKNSKYSFNDRQRKVLNLLMDDFKGNLTTSKWAKITNCSQDTAHRDIVDLISKGILTKNVEGGRSTNYLIVPS